MHLNAAYTTTLGQASNFLQRRLVPTTKEEESYLNAYLSAVLASDSTGIPSRAVPC
jgi:hypothetical protein